MCLIIYAPKGQEVPREVLSYSASQNDDGIGVMSRDGVRKYLGKKMLKRARRYIETVLVPNAIPYAVHMRWATHGDVNLDNTHPYETPEKTHYVMHNGIISLTTAESSAAESDTAVYVRKFLDKMGDIETDAAFYKQVGTHIGWGNKLVVMDSQARFAICNEDAGTWIEGVWYSNTYSLPASFLPNRSRYAGSYAGYGWVGGGYDDDYDDTRGRVATSNYQKGWSFCTQMGTWYNPETHEVIQRTWQNGHKSYMIILKDTAANMSSNMSVIELGEKLVEKTSGGDKDYPRKDAVPILPRSMINTENGPWSHEEREAYYEALEAGLTEAEAQQYMDTGYISQGADVGETAASRAITPSELEKLRKEQEAILAATMAEHDKPDAPVGGDFAPNDEAVAETPPWREYLKRIAATVHV